MLTPDLWAPIADYLAHVHAVPYELVYTLSDVFEPEMYIWQRLKHNGKPWTINKPLTRNAIGDIFQQYIGAHVDPDGDKHRAPRQHHDYTPYSMRHTFACTLRDLGISTRDIGKGMAHESEKSTEKYFNKRPQPGVTGARDLFGNMTLWLNNFGLYDRKSTESSTLEN